MLRSASLLAIGASLLVSACSMPTMPNLWPFGRDDTGTPYVPPNSTRYACNNGSGFYLRKLDDGNMWVIYNDRQIRLDKQANGSFSNGIATLTFEGATAALRDGPQINYSNCAISQAKPK